MTKKNQRLGLTEINGHKVLYVARRAVLTEDGWYRLRRGKWVRNNKSCWKRDYPKKIGHHKRQSDKLSDNNRKQERMFQHRF